MNLRDRMTPYVAQNYHPIPEAGCWLWAGSIDGDGYGKLGRHGKHLISPHRLFYTFYKGDIPEGMVVMHKCDTPSCCNPDHLTLGSHSDNIKDSLRKGRKTPGRRSITREQAIEIIGFKGVKSAQKLQYSYGLKACTIRDIWNGRSWKELEPYRLQAATGGAE